MVLDHSSELPFREGKKRKTEQNRDELHDLILLLKATEEKTHSMDARQRSMHDQLELLKEGAQEDVCINIASHSSVHRSLLTNLADNVTEALRASLAYENEMTESASRTLAFAKTEITAIELVATRLITSMCALDITRHHAQDIMGRDVNFSRTTIFPRILFAEISGYSP
ncbi:uncharacterized protein LOC108864434 [Galendromus occidentalis]|uniref:Uncharacterized protein LOC108864434 n=1 Tax=Galendromus occidentalis TaxID=34638 RepID=A0AAJ7L4N9_9ACAR|nr:uncharacterized protein LOC108864434 [Galendromus occidentalis]